MKEVTHAVERSPDVTDDKKKSKKVLAKRYPVTKSSPKRLKKLATKAKGRTGIAYSEYDRIRRMAHRNA
jgi:hypothetical protein